MKHSKKTRKLVTIRVKADQGTETFIIDRNLNLKKRGVGNFTTRQRPGEYRFKFRRGTAINIEKRRIGLQKLFTIEAELPKLIFSSPAVLQGTRKTHEYHILGATQSSRDVHKWLGKGSQLFVFNRAWTTFNGFEPPGYLIGKDPAAGLTLHDLAGNILVNFEHEGVRKLTEPGNSLFDPWAACNIEIAPGSYRLRLQTPNFGAVERVVVASPNWQTQIFLLQKQYVDNGPPRDYCANLSDAAIMLEPAGAGFSEFNEKFKLCEIARIALEDGRCIIAKSLLEKSLSHNPMLGIYGAHALISSRRPDRRLLRKVVTKLRKLIGFHPDVEALALFLDGKIGMSNACTIYETPPMLSSSWSILVESSIKNSNIAPYGSLSARIATHLWGDSVWLMWLADKLEDTHLIPDAQSTLEDDLHRIWNKTRTLDIDERRGCPRALVTDELGLNNYEGVLLAYVARAHDTSARDRMTAWSAKALCSSVSGREGLSQQKVFVDALGVPPAAVRATARSLLHKLESH